jgi:hypothetical protein
VALKRAAAAQVPPPTKREGFVTCPRCSFDNSVALVACQMCREPLGAGALAAQRLPEVLHCTVLFCLYCLYAGVPFGLFSVLSLVPRARAVS